MSLFPKILGAQPTRVSSDSTKYNHFLKLDLFGLTYSVLNYFNTPNLGNYYVSVEYEAQLNQRQTYALAIDYNESTRQLWVRPVWRFYHREAFNNVFIGAFPAYIHAFGRSSYDYYGNYFGLGLIAGAQSRLGKRFSFEFNIRWSRQFGSYRVYDSYTGQYRNESDQFNAAAIQLNLGYGIGRKK